MADDRILMRLAELADSLGPALVPPGHDELLESIADTAMSIFGAAACSIALLEDEESDEPRLVFHVAVGRGADAILDLSVPATEGIVGFVVRSGQPLMIDDVSRDPRFARSVAGETGYVPSSIIATPLETDRGVLGVLEILDPDKGSVALERGMELLGHFARLAALALESARIFRDLGRVLFSAAGRALEHPSIAGSDDDAALSGELARIAETSRSPDRELAELAGMFVELERLGPDERKVVGSIVLSFLRYAIAARGASG